MERQKRIQDRADLSRIVCCLWKKEKWSRGNKIEWLDSIANLENEKEFFHGGFKNLTQRKEWVEDFIWGLPVKCFSWSVVQQVFHMPDLFC